MPIFTRLVQESEYDKNVQTLKKTAENILIFLIVFQLSLLHLMKMAYMRWTKKINLYDDRNVYFVPKHHRTQLNYQLFYLFSFFLFVTKEYKGDDLSI